METVVDIKDLRVDFTTDAGEVRAVDGVSFQVNAGEVLAIVGESGSGKSVSAKTILRLLPENTTVSGAVVLAGQDVVTLSPAQMRAARGRDVAMVFQEPSTALNPVFTVGWQIAEGLRASEQMKDWATMMEIEFVHISKQTTVENLEQQLFLADLAWKLK